MIRFKVLEVIRGSMQSELICRDISSIKMTSTIRRRRTTLCARVAVRAVVSPIPIVLGGQFLLLLKKRQSGGFTVNWYALGPVNEQRHSSNDPWLLWFERRSKQIVSNGM
jgi:hypothetical protein